MPKDYGNFFKPDRQPTDLHPPPVRSFQPRYIPFDQTAGKQRYDPAVLESEWERAPHQNFPGAALKSEQRISCRTETDNYRSSRKWDAKVRKPCRPVTMLGTDGAPYGAGKNLDDGLRGRVTTKQMEYRAPPANALMHPGKRRQRHYRGNAYREESLQPVERDLREQGATSAPPELPMVKGATRIEDDGGDIGDARSRKRSPRTTEPGSVAWNGGAAERELRRKERLEAARQERLSELRLYHPSGAPQVLEFSALPPLLLLLRSDPTAGAGCRIL